MIYIRGGTGRLNDRTSTLGAEAQEDVSGTEIAPPQELPSEKEKEAYSTDEATMMTAVEDGSHGGWWKFDNGESER